MKAELLTADGTSPPGETERTLPATGGSSLVMSSHVTWKTVGQILTANDGLAATATAQVGAGIMDSLPVLGHRTFRSFWFEPEMSLHR